MRSKKQCAFGIFAVWIIVYSVAYLNMFGFNFLSASSIPNNLEGRYNCIDVGEVPNETHDVIPKHIHQMFFYETDKVIPEALEQARNTWTKNHPGFKYTLWNATTVQSLISTRYPRLLNVYDSYTHWVRRADMARYVVLHTFGGIYIDLDIKSKGVDLNNLYDNINKTSGVVLYLTNPPITSNDFMMSKPYHPFMTHVLCGLRDANHWYGLPYLTTMMATGPLFLNSRFKSYSNKTDIELLDLKVMARFVQHIDGASWHQLDGILIWKIFIHRRKIFKIIKIALAVLVSVILIVISLKVIFILRIRWTSRKLVR